MTDDPAPWRGTVNAILYTLIFARRLDQAEVERVAGMIRDGQGLTAGRAAYLRAIDQALDSADGLPAITDHSDADIRTFLVRLRRNLDGTG
jgi:hypothetical protein